MVAHRPSEHVAQIGCGMHSAAGTASHEWQKAGSLCGLPVRHTRTGDEQAAHTGLNALLHAFTLAEHTSIVGIASAMAACVRMD